MAVHTTVGGGFPFLTSGNDQKQNRLRTGRLRVALVQGAVSLTDQFLNRIKDCNIQISFLGSPENILRHLEFSLEEIDIILYPIWTQWQRSLDFARETRRIRERHGAPPCPQVLILSFVEQPPTAVHWLRLTHGTGYSRFISEEHLVQVLWAMREKISEAQRACRLYLRFVHSGNPSGLGCVLGEKIVAAYGSFLPGRQEQITAQTSVLRFMNLLATGRWQFRSAPELIDLMTRHPLYCGSTVPSIGSVKTYIARAEDTVSDLWRASSSSETPPIVILRESRGKKEVAYRLLCNAEFEHI